MMLWDMFEMWLVTLAVMWALWTIVKGFSGKGPSCGSACDKKIFQEDKKLIRLGRKARI